VPELPLPVHPPQLPAFRDEADPGLPYPRAPRGPELHLPPLRRREPAPLREGIEQGLLGLGADGFHGPGDTCVQLPLQVLVAGVLEPARDGRELVGTVEFNHGASCGGT
jgi:hypothetical protein